MFTWQFGMYMPLILGFCPFSWNTLEMPRKLESKFCSCLARCARYAVKSTVVRRWCWIFYNFLGLIMSSRSFFLCLKSIVKGVLLVASGHPLRSRYLDWRVTIMAIMLIIVSRPMCGCTGSGNGVCHHYDEQLAWTHAIHFCKRSSKPRKEERRSKQQRRRTLKYEASWRKEAGRTTKRTRSARSTPPCMHPSVSCLR